MPSEKDILNALIKVMDPELGKNIVELDMVRDIRITPNGKVTFTLNLTIPNCPLRSEMQDNARKVLLELPGVSEVDVQFGAMTPEQAQAAIAKAQQNLPKLTALNKIDRVIAVLSGKGGVGKSSVTAMLAVALTRAGKKVGILDADITGPSIPKLFGLASGGVRGSAQGMLPAITCGGVKVISANLLLKEEDAAIIWRGPMISRAIEQFWNETLWGKLDFLLVDMPPGTSDAAISVMQSLPVNGVLLVTSPQELSALVVRKAVGMMQMLNVEALGVIENMSYFECPSCGQRHEIFGPSHAAEITAAAHAPLLAQLPLRPEVTALGDEGRIEELQAPEFDPIVDLLT